MTKPASFDASVFRKPGHDSCLTYSWIWTVELSYDEIRAQIDEMESGGIRNVYVIPEPPEFRPDFAPTTLAPAYLGDAFMEMFAFAVDYGKTRDVHFWLYDEGGWPSGMANGLTCQDHPELKARSVKQTERLLKAGETWLPGEDSIALFSADRVRLAPGYTPREDETVLEYVLCSPQPFNNLYPDLLNPAATERFIETTHERYRAYVGGEFGKTIPYMFTDEPAIHGPGWPFGIEEDFRRTFGYDLRDRLPALFDKNLTDEREIAARIDYYEWWSRKFADNFLGQLQSWCRQNNLLSVGHMGGDDETVGSGKYGYGHILRTLRKFDVPGVDAIISQIDQRAPGTIPYRFANAVKPIGTNHFFPRFASSAATQTGSRFSLTESFGVYGPIACQRQRYVIGFQLARGINRINAMSISYGRTGSFMTGIDRATRHDPSFYNARAFLESVSRACYLMGLGDPAGDTALYLSLHDLWANQTLMQAAGDAFDRAGRMLESAPCFFDVVDDDFLTEASLTQDTLQMGLARYRTVVIPECRMMPDATRSRLEAFLRQGGRVLQVTDGPATICGAEAVSLRGLRDAVTPTARILQLQTEGDLPPVHEGDPSLRVNKRRLPEGSLYYIFNEALAAQTFTMAFDESAPVYRLDTEDGGVYALSGTPVCSADGTTLQLRLASGESVCLLFTDAPVGSLPEPAFRYTDTPVCMELTDFSACQTMQMRMGEYEAHVDLTPSRPVPIALGDWAPVFGADFSGRVMYSTCFRLSEVRDLLLELGKVAHTCEVFLNGRRQAVLCAEPYRCLLHARDLKSENRLEIIVANTTVNQHAYTDVMKKWTVNQLGPYYDTAIELCKIAIPSGLYGPVTLRPV